MATNVSTRVVRPNYVYGFVSGLIASVVVAVWVAILGGGHQAAYVASLVHGSAVQQPTAADSALGFVIHFVVFALLGVLFAALWPTIRRRGLLLPTLAFWLIAYVVLHQIGIRILKPEAFHHLAEWAIGSGFLLSAVVFMRRYRGR